MQRRRINGRLSPFTPFISWTANTTEKSTNPTKGRASASSKLWPSKPTSASGKTTKRTDWVWWCILRATLSTPSSAGTSSTASPSSMTVSFCASALYRVLIRQRRPRLRGNRLRVHFRHFNLENDKVLSRETYRTTEIGTVDSFIRVT